MISRPSTGRHAYSPLLHFYQLHGRTLAATFAVLALEEAALARAGEMKLDVQPDLSRPCEITGGFGGTGHIAQCNCRNVH